MIDDDHQFAQFKRIVSVLNLFLKCSKTAFIGIRVHERNADNYKLLKIHNKKLTLIAKHKFKAVNN